MSENHEKGGDKGMLVKQMSTHKEEYKDVYKKGPVNMEQVR